MNAAAIAVARETTALNLAGPAEVPAVAPLQALTPMQMVYQLIAAGASTESVEKMMALSERLAADAARRAFDAAVADAKAEIRPILKNRRGHTGKYADLAAYAAGIDEILGRHGLSYRHTVPAQTEKTITVACKLSHRDGHSEITPLTSGFDTSGSKNAIQSMGSALTYLQRYSLVLALGLAASEDDDGAATAAGSMAINDQQRDELDKLIETTGSDLDKFLAYFKVDFLAELPAARFAEAKRLLEHKRK